MGEDAAGNLPSFLQPTKAHLEREKGRRPSTAVRRRTVVSAADGSFPSDLAPSRRKTAYSVPAHDETLAKLAAVAAKRAGALDDEDEIKQPRFKTFQSQQRVRHCTQECLKVVPLFKRCSMEFVEMLAEQVTTQIFDSGCDIVRQGETGESMYVLNRGEVDILVNGSKVAVLGDGSVFGEMAAICRNQLAARRTATVRAKSICDCRVIGREALSTTLSRFRADELIIEAEANKRLQELRAKGMLPSASEWWRPPAPKLVSKDELQGSSVTPGRRSTLMVSPLHGPEGLRRKSDGDPYALERCVSDVGSVLRPSVVDYNLSQVIASRPKSAMRDTSSYQPEIGHGLAAHRSMSISPAELEVRASIRSQLIDMPPPPSPREGERKARSSMDGLTAAMRSFRTREDAPSPLPHPQGSRTPTFTSSKSMPLTPRRSKSKPPPETEASSQLPLSSRQRSRHLSLAINSPYHAALAKTLSDEASRQGPPLSSRQRSRHLSLAINAPQGAALARALSDGAGKARSTTPSDCQEELRVRCLSDGDAEDNRRSVQRQTVPIPDVQPLSMGMRRLSEASEEHRKPENDSEGEKEEEEEEEQEEEELELEEESLRTAPTSEQNSGSASDDECDRETSRITSRNSFLQMAPIPLFTPVPLGDEDPALEARAAMEREEAVPEEEEGKEDAGAEDEEADVAEPGVAKIGSSSSQVAADVTSSHSKFARLGTWEEIEKARSFQHEREAAAIKIQSLQRGRVGRKRCFGLRQSRERQVAERARALQHQQDAAAVRIQAVHRGQSARMRAYRMQQKRRLQDPPVQFLLAQMEGPLEEPLVEHVRSRESVRSRDSVRRRAKDASGDTQSQPLAGHSSSSRPGRTGSRASGASGRNSSVLGSAGGAALVSGEPAASGGEAPGASGRGSVASAGAGGPSEGGGAAAQSPAGWASSPSSGGGLDGLEKGAEVATVTEPPLGVEPTWSAAATLGGGGDACTGDLPSLAKPSRGQTPRTSLAGAQGAKLPGLPPQRVALAAAAVAAAAVAVAAAEHCDPTSPAVLAAAERQAALKDAPQVGPRLPACAVSRASPPATGQPQSARATTSKERKQAAWGGAISLDFMDGEGSVVTDSSASVPYSARELRRRGMRNYWTVKDASAFADRGAQRVACGRVVAHEMPIEPLDTTRIMKPTANSRHRVNVTQLCHPEIPEQREFRRSLRLQCQPSPSPQHQQRSSQNSARSSPEKDKRAWMSVATESLQHKPSHKQRAGPILAS